MQSGQATRHSHFAVSYERNKYFVGRESIIEHFLANVLPSADTSHCRRRAVIVGLAGVQDTQTAPETASQVHEKHL